MFKSILVATDGSATAEKALDIGLKLAREQDAALLVLTSTTPVDNIYGGGFGPIDSASITARVEEAYAEQAGSILAAAASKADAKGIDAELLHLPNRHPAQAIIETAEARKVDLIVMGSHGRRGLERLLLGSQASEVLTQARVPVLIAK
nr:universal stress protein [uncultured Devosia sp.]